MHAKILLFPLYLCFAFLYSMNFFFSLISSSTQFILSTLSLFFSLSLIDAWKRVLEKHRYKLLESLDPMLVVDALRSEGLTEAEENLILASPYRNGQVSGLLHFLGIRPALATVLTTALRRDALLPSIAEAIEHDLQAFNLHACLQ